MNPIVITAPTTYPLSIDDVKGQTNAESGDFDAKIAGYIAAATTLVEGFVGRALITRTYRGFMDCWPRDRRWGCQANSFDLPYGPLQSVTSIKTYDDSDVATTLDPATYYVDTGSLVGRIVRRVAATWTDPDRAANGIEVNWIAGFGNDPTNVPPQYKHAMMLLASHWLEHPDAVVGVDARDSAKELPLGVAELLRPYVAYTL